MLHELWLIKEVEMGLYFACMHAFTLHWHIQHLAVAFIQSHRGLRASFWSPAGTTCHRTDSTEGSETGNMFTNMDECQVVQNMF